MKPRFGAADRKHVGYLSVDANSEESAALEASTFAPAESDMPGNEGCQRLQEFDGLEEEVRRAITPGGLEFDENAPVGVETVHELFELGRRA